MALSLQTRMTELFLGSGENKWIEKATWLNLLLSIGAGTDLFDLACFRRRRPFGKRPRRASQPRSRQARETRFVGLALVKQPNVPLGIKAFCANGGEEKCF